MSWGGGKEQGCWKRALLSGGMVLGGGSRPYWELCIQGCWVMTRASHVRAATPYPLAAPDILWRVANNAPGGGPYSAPQKA